MLLALIILALWVAILAPGVVRWLRHHQPTTSIASFHRQLRLLEGSGPKLVEPAYRLEVADSMPLDMVAPSPAHPVPQLVLVPTGATEKESLMRDDDRYETAGEWDDPWEPEARAMPRHATRTVRAPSDYEPEYDDDRDDYVVRRHLREVTMTPDRAKVRRTRILVGIGGALGASFVLGMLPSMTFLWAVSLIAFVALVAYLGLMFYASNAGMYGTDVSEPPTRVARVVVPAYDQFAEDDRYDDGWDTGRVAAAR